MAKMKKEKKQGEIKQGEVRKIKKVVKITNNAPVIVAGKKYNPAEIIENIDENVMNRLVNEGIAEWVEN